MNAGRGRWLVLTTGALVLVVAALIALNWREVAVRYHVWRLDRAITQEEANPWLEALARDSKEAGMSETIVRKLGPGNQNFTFWFFSALERLADFKNDRREFKFLAREACRRMERDEPLLAWWAHYLRWRGDPLLERCLEDYQDERKISVGAVWNVDGDGIHWSRLVPMDSDPTHFLAVALEVRGISWLLVLEPPPPMPDLDKIDHDESRRYFQWIDEWCGWMNSYRGAHRFSSELGRWIPGKSGDPPETSIPVPRAPFPVWSGPIPHLSIVLSFERVRFQSMRPSRVPLPDGAVPPTPLPPPPEQRLDAPREPRYR
jgi:hypothetical protein